MKHATMPLNRTERPLLSPKGVSTDRFRKDEDRNAYFLDDNPLIGTTTALSILDKPGLTYWASGMACAEFGWLNPKKASQEDCQKAPEVGLDNVRQMSLGEYFSHLNKASRAHNEKKKSTATEGTGLHTVLEAFIRNHMAGTPQLLSYPRIVDFAAWAVKNVKRFLFTEMCCYSKVLNCAGTADFGYEDMQGKIVLGDFKSSETAYYAHYLQCGAYDLQISENGGFTKDGKQILPPGLDFDRYEIFCFRAGLGKPFVSRETQRLKRAFSYCVNLYRESIWWKEAIDKKESGIKEYRR